MDDRRRTYSKRRQDLAQTYAVVLTFILIASSAAFAAAPEHAGPKTHIVSIEGMHFNPQALTVQRGDRIVWVNKDLFRHSATADVGAFDSHSIEPNASWTYMPKGLGDYPYACSFHPTMKGTLTVR